MKQPCIGTGVMAINELCLYVHMQWLSVNNCKEKKNLLKSFFSIFLSSL